MIDAVLERIDTLEQFPERGAPVPELELLGRDGIRTLPVLPYRLLYRVHQARVTVRMIYHMRRDFAGLLEERLARDGMLSRWRSVRPKLSQHADSECHNQNGWIGVGA